MTVPLLCFLGPPGAATLGLLLMAGARSSLWQQLGAAALARVLQTRRLSGVQVLRVKTQGHVRTMTGRQKTTQTVDTVPVLFVTKC